MRTALINVDPPSSFVTVDDVKKQLRIDDGDTSKDDLLGMYIDAACGFLDGADGSLKRAVSEQSWKLILSSFRLGSCPPWRIELPLPPCRAVTGIQYFAPGIAEIQILDPTAYRLVNRGTERSRLVPSTGWPTTQCREDAVQIAFTAGYGDGDDLIPMPRQIAQAVVLMVKSMYDMGERNVFLTGDGVIGVGYKQYQVSDTAAQLMQRTVDNLLYNIRIQG